MTSLGYSYRLIIISPHHKYVELYFIGIKYLELMIKMDLIVTDVVCRKCHHRRENNLVCICKLYINRGVCICVIIH